MNVIAIMDSSVHDATQSPGSASSAHAPRRVQPTADGLDLSAAAALALRLELERMCRLGMAGGASFIRYHGIRIWFRHHMLAPQQPRVEAPMEAAACRHLHELVQFLCGSEFKAHIFCVETPSVAFCFSSGSEAEPLCGSQEAAGQATQTPGQHHPSHLPPHHHWPHQHHPASRHRDAQRRSGSPSPSLPSFSPPRQRPPSASSSPGQHSPHRHRSPSLHTTCAGSTPCRGRLAPGRLARMS